MWSETRKDRHGRAAPATVAVFVPKACSTVENLEDPGNIFRLFMDDDIIEKIYKHMNEQMERRKEQRKQKDQSYYRDCTKNEIFGLISLLILAGIQKSGKLNMEEIWLTGFGINIYCVAMSEHRIHYLLSCLRFDDQETQKEHVRNDNFAP